MNTILQILLTGLLVGGGIGGYHLLTSDGAPAPVGEEASLDYGRRLTALEERVRDLQDRGPVLQGTVDAQALWEQLHRLGERVDDVEKGPRVADGARTIAGVTEPPEARPDAPGGEITLEDGTPSPLSEAEERRVRELLQDSMRDRMQDRMQDWANRRLDRTLRELGIELADDQKEKLNRTLGEHMQSVRETMRQARDDGIPREERSALLAPLTEQLTRKISEFLPIVDAEAITKALPAPGRGGGVPRGGRRGEPR